MNTTNDRSNRKDFNDMAAIHGNEAVARVINAAINNALSIDKGCDENPYNTLNLNASHSSAPSVYSSAAAAYDHYNDSDSTNYNDSQSNTIAWPDPSPLPCGLLPVMPFDFELLPEALRPWVADIAHRVQCPPDFPAVGAVIALATVLGRKIGIHPKRQDDWLEVPNLWGAIVGKPGVMKSPALRASLQPLQRLETTASNGFTEQYADWERGGELHKLKMESRKVTIKAKLKKGNDVGIDDMPSAYTEGEPMQKRYIVNDCTVEALGVILQANPNGVLAYRDELIGLLKSLDKEGNEGARGFFLTGWNGKDPYTFDRIGRGFNLRIDACCLSLLGSIQPSVIGEYLRQTVASNGGDGLISRFQLLVWPDISSDWVNVDQWPDTEARAAAVATFERLDALDPVAIGAIGAIGANFDKEGVPYLHFDAQAQLVFDTWLGSLETRIRSDSDHDAITTHLSKYRKLVPALALLFHLADNTSSAIGTTALYRALSWAQYLESHARRAYASVMQTEIAGARALLKHIESNHISNPFTYRDVYMKRWKELTIPEATREAVRYLVDLDYLRMEEQPTDGRTKIVIWINPKVRAV